MFALEGKGGVLLLIAQCAELRVGLKTVSFLLVRGGKKPLVSALPLSLICLNNVYEGNTDRKVFADADNFKTIFLWGK